MPDTAILDSTPEALSSARSPASACRWPAPSRGSRTSTRTRSRCSTPASRAPGARYRLGITGPPGAGKSTLVTKLALEYRARGLTVAIVAVDPTSPFSGGALLGDRVRMQELSGDEGVFIRSMATRGSMGGLAVHTAQVCDVLDAAGFDRVLIETVGVGQSELEVAQTADTTAVVLVPESGDAVQAMKAGLMEIADVFVINKSDREGADRAAQAIRSALHLRAKTSEWDIPVLMTSASLNRRRRRADRTLRSSTSPGSATAARSTAAAASGSRSGSRASCASGCGRASRKASRPGRGSAPWPIWASGARRPTSWHRGWWMGRRAGARSSGHFFRCFMTGKVPCFRCPPVKVWREAAAAVEDPMLSVTHRARVFILSALLSLLALALLTRPAHSAWSADPVQVHATSALCPLVGACDDGHAGAIIVWQENTASGGLLKARHLLASGDVDPAWSAPATVSSLDVARAALGVLTDGTGGSYVWWMESAQLWLTHVTAAGSVAPGWSARGRNLGPLPSANLRPVAVADGSGGVYVGWLTVPLFGILPSASIRVVHVGPTGVSSGWLACRWADVRLRQPHETDRDVVQPRCGTRRRAVAGMGGRRRQQPHLLLLDCQLGVG